MAVAEIQKLIAQRQAEIEKLNEAERLVEEVQNGSHTNGNTTVAPTEDTQTRTGQRGARRTRRSGGGRAEQFRTLVQENPGISVADAAKRMKIQPNYLYRVASGLEKDKAIKKDGKGYVAA